MRLISAAIAIAFGSVLSTTPVSAQVSVMVRTDRTDLATEKNVPNSLEKVQQRAAAKGGTWDTLLANDTTCGGGAVAIAYTMGDRRYFLVTGKLTASEANAEAMRLAREFASSRKGWITTAGPSWLNVNKYQLGADGTEWVLERLGVLDRCAEAFEEMKKNSPQPPGSMGVRG